MNLPPELQPTPISDEKLLALRRAILTLEAADIETATAFGGLLLTKTDDGIHLEIAACCTPMSACIFALEFITKTVDELQARTQLSTNDTYTLLACSAARELLLTAVTRYMENPAP